MGINGENSIVQTIVTLAYYLAGYECGQLKGGNCGTPEQLRTKM